ncbi:BlaI/MecI/CopY family transcriptional regulator [bacterium D16-51]|nr:BlaI/MecI/CopY family transcriptional regulator [bacterium D16-59]RKI62916.1 BlaI/MecI/CopY family transcriptional regulator [bacterium D16-51]
MKVIWESGSSLLFAQIVEALAVKGIAWQKNTLITLLSRLMDKGYLKADKCGRKNEYIPLVTEQDFQVTQTRNFVDRIYKGNVSGLINRLVENDMLTETEYSELKKILEVDKWKKR